MRVIRASVLYTTAAVKANGQRSSLGGRVVCTRCSRQFVQCPSSTHSVRLFGVQASHQQQQRLVLSWWLSGEICCAYSWRATGSTEGCSHACVATGYFKVCVVPALYAVRRKSTYDSVTGDDSSAPGNLIGCRNKTPPVKENPSSSYKLPRKLKKKKTRSIGDVRVS